jgi:flagellar basal-body rod modification protein FlgD
VSTINGIYSGSQTGDKMPGTETSGNNMGQDAFMKLLSAQLQNQDPLKPQENGEFLSQLATFSSLEKLTSIEAAVKEMTAAFQAILGDPAENDTDAGDTSSDGTSNDDTSNTSGQ